MSELPQPPSFDLSGKRALVVGASRGIGLASATALAGANAEVFLAARSTTALEEQTRVMNGRGRVTHAVSVDARDPEAIDRLFATHGPFDVVVNSVGTNRPALLSETPDRDIDDVVHLNLKVALYIARAAVRTMQSTGIRGSIISVSSQMGHVGSPKRALYSATKHALDGLTKSLAWEAGRDGIRVNCVCPTFIETQLTAPMFEEPGFREWVEAQTALGRAGRLEEVMGPIVFLASDASSLMTGASLMLDAGWTAR